MWYVFVYKICYRIYTCRTTVSIPKTNNDEISNVLSWLQKWHSLTYLKTIWNLLYHQNCMSHMSPHIVELQIPNSGLAWRESFQNLYISLLFLVYIKYNPGKLHVEWVTFVSLKKCEKKQFDLVLTDLLHMTHAVSNLQTSHVFGMQT